MRATRHWNWPLIAIHWVSAMAVFALFALGLWMVELGYYHPWRLQAPHWHKSFGALLFLLTLLRLIWRWLSASPTALPNHSRMMVLLAKSMHAVLYALLLLVAISGYLISSADGRAVAVFNWFSIPSGFSAAGRQAEIAGVAHYILAILLVALAALHTAAALKHHFFDQDRTLKRMLGL